MRIRALIAAALAAVAAVPLTSMNAAAGTSIEGVPRVDHVVVLVLENESFSSTWSPTSAAKYLNSLPAGGAFVPNYYGTGHVSLDNYVAMTSGLAGAQVASTYTDCLGINLWACVQEVSAAATVNGGSIADQVEAAGLSWKQYADGTSQPCVHADYSPTAAGQDPFQGDGNAANTAGAGPDYADRHVPFLYYSSIIGDSARCDAHLRPFTELSGDLAANSLPNYSFITPDTCDDGHDNPCSSGKPGGLASADAFLVAHIPALIAYLRAHNGVLFVTFDEGGASDTGGCCTGGPGGVSGFGGQVGMVALGAPVGVHVTTQSKYDHASLLRTTEDMLGITTHLGNAATASPITGIWTQPAVASTTTPAGSSPTTGGGATAGALPNTSAPTGAPTALLAAAALAATLALGGARRRRRRTDPPPGA